VAAGAEERAWKRFELIALLDAAERVCAPARRVKQARQRDFPADHYPNVRLTDLIHISRKVCEQRPRIT
jgi:hypothetical protein